MRARLVAALGRDRRKCEKTDRRQDTGRDQDERVGQISACRETESDRNDNIERKVGDDVEIATKIGRPGSPGELRLDRMLLQPLRRRRTEERA